MYTAITVIHIIVCLFVIFIILIQSSKGAEMGAAFGGSSQTLFGSRGASTFMSKLTTGTAILFMVTSLLLAVLASRQSSVMSSLPAQEIPSQPIPDTSAGPITDQPAPTAPGQGEVKEQSPAPAETPAAPVDDKK
jgi:preprotein translocase subunit SecG